MRISTRWLAGLVLACAAQIAAADHPNLDANAIRQQQAQIRADAEAGKGIYRRMSEAQRAKLFTQQDRVYGLLRSDVRHTTDLNEIDRIALFNSLETIEAIVNNAEDERMICERYKPTGSKRPMTICRTAAERKADREESLKDYAKRNLQCSEATMGPGGRKN